MTYLSMGAVQADAVFVSRPQRCDELGAGQVRQAVAAAVRAFARSSCDGRVAQEFGNHPDTAVLRMRWARDFARKAFADWPPGPGPGTDAAWLVVRPRRPAERASGTPAAGQAWASPSCSGRGRLMEEGVIQARAMRLARPGNQVIAGEAPL